MVDWRKGGGLEERRRGLEEGWWWIMRDISVHVSLALPGDGEKKWRKISLIKHRFGECAAGGGIVDEDEKRNAANHSLLELCSVHVNGRTFRNRTEVAKFIQRMLLASDHVFDIDVDTEEDGVVGQKEPIPFHIISLGSCLIYSVNR